MGIEQGVAIITESFNNTNVFGTSLVIPLLVMIITLVLITRNIKEWKALALPLAVAYAIAGLKISFLIYLVAIFLFVIEVISIESIDEIIGVKQYLRKKEERRKAESSFRRQVIKHDLKSKRQKALKIIYGDDFKADVKKSK